MAACLLNPLFKPHKGKAIYRDNQPKTKHLNQVISKTGQEVDLVAKGKLLFVLQLPAWYRT